MNEQASIWEGVYRGDPEVRATWNSKLVYVCRACKFEKPHHHKDCLIAALKAKLAAMERLKQYATHRIGCSMLPCDCGLLDVLAAAQLEGD